MSQASCLDFSRLSCAVLLLFLGLFATNKAEAAGARCEAVFHEAPTGASSATFREVIQVMERGAYDPAKLPVIPLRMFKWVGSKFSFFVANRSKEILRETRDFREVPMEKPIHPMGVGLVGRLKMMNSRWSGLFRGGEFPLVARASISQGNPFKYDQSGQMQVRSTAMAVKVFDVKNEAGESKTANAVFQNDLNGQLGRDGRPLNYLDSEQTNQPGLSFSKIRHAYEVHTLLGVAFGSLMNRHDHTSKVPFINPQIRPVHSWAEMGEVSPKDVRPPVWVKISPRRARSQVEESDFRLEISRTLEKDGELIFDLYAADQQDSRGRIQWELVGEMSFDRAILSEGVDKNLLFPHDGFNSRFTEEKFAIPPTRKQYDSVPDDVQ